MQQLWPHTAHATGTSPWGKKIPSPKFRSNNVLMNSSEPSNLCGQYLSKYSAVSAFKRSSRTSSGNLGTSRCMHKLLVDSNGYINTSNSMWKIGESYEWRGKMPFTRLGRRSRLASLTDPWVCRCTEFWSSRKIFLWILRPCIEFFSANIVLEWPGFINKREKLKKGHELLLNMLT